MKRLIALVSLIFSAYVSHAWSQDGHRIIAEVAMHYLDSSTRQKVLYILGGTTPADAATWMDEQRGKPAYDYMIPWHYVNFDKGKYYSPAQGGDIVSTIDKLFLEMLSSKRLSADQQKKNLFILFHLIGDIHQPLHVGYSSDKGGNDVQVHFNGHTTNLCGVWDNELIKSQHITAAAILDYAAQFSGDDFIAMSEIGVERWMEESRKLLTQVYDFNSANLSNDYIARSKNIMQLQLLRAGVRLSAVLKWSYKNYVLEQETRQEAVQQTVLPKPQTEQGGQMPVPLNAAEIAKDISSPKYVCDKVYDTKYVAATGVTYISVGGFSPNAPLVLVIFKKNRKKFIYKPEAYLEGKNVCIFGQIKERGGNAEIIVTEPWQIEIK